MKLSVREAARLLEVSEQAVQRWIERRGLPAQRIGDEYRLSRPELLEWATAERVPLSPALFEELRGEPPPSLAQALATGGIHRIAAESQTEALRELVARLPLGPEPDRAHLCEMLAAREACGTTAVGDGIAIPHARSPVVLPQPPALALGLLERPLALGAADGEPVSALFLLLCPTPRLHLQLLARLGAALHDAALRGALRERAAREVLLAALARAEAGLARAGAGVDAARGARAP